MSNQIQCQFSSGRTLYALVRNSVGQIWNLNTIAFENYNSVNYANYVITLTEQGSNGFYTGDFPAQITPGVFSIVAHQQVTGSPAQTDPFVGEETYQWNGNTTLPLSDLSTSGQVAQIAPIKIYRGQMVKNFPFKLVSSADHVTNFTSGVVSGQISRDGGLFGPLQSGAYTEIGNGYYSLQAFTSGDFLANTAAVFFTANGISGGTADQRDFVFVMQRSSGQN